MTLYLLPLLSMKLSDLSVINYVKCRNVGPELKKD